MRSFDPKRRRAVASKFVWIFLIVLLGLLIFGGCGYGLYDYANNPQPTKVNPNNQSILYTDNTQDEGLSAPKINLPTSTPAPNYAATQAALDAAIAQHEQDIKRQMARATGTAEALAIEHQSKLYKIELDEAGITLAQAVADAQFQENLNTQSYSTTLRIDENKVRAEKMESYWMAWIRIGTALAIRVLIAVLVVWFLVALVLTWWKNNRPEPKPLPPQHIRLEVATEDNRSRRFANLNVDPDRFRQWARAAVDGKSLVYSRWVGLKQGNLFSRPEYDQLTDIMHGMGIMAEDQLTERGKKALEGMLNAV